MKEASMSTTATNPETVTAIRKALRVNMDEFFYGSFAEIGAGQDVANTFFEAGGASLTIAKTMSAYDMVFSDSIYGAEVHGRYVSESRLKKMLHHEYNLLEERLGQKKKDVCFFSFANTVTTINYQKTKPGHGWIGCRFQTHPDKAPNDLIIHVRLKEPEKLLQHKTLGVIGTNVIYACRFLTHDPETMMNSLMDNLSWSKLEVDMFRLSGPDFTHIDGRLMSLKLVKNGLTDATMFLPNGDVIQASDLLYGKNVLVLRSRFKPITKLSVDMATNAIRDFIAEPDIEEHDTEIISELTLNNLKVSDRDIDEQDFLDRVDILCSLGQTVMISNFKEHYVLSKYISQHFTKKKVGIVLGVPSLIKLFNEKYYIHLQGGVLEALSRLFTTQTKMYVYPMLDSNGEVITIDNLELPAEVRPLFNYLALNKKIVNLNNFDKSLLSIQADEVLQMLQNGNSQWEQYVPVYVANIIKEKKVYGYKTV
jgi:hypothetical protein